MDSPDGVPQRSVKAALPEGVTPNASRIHEEKVIAAWRDFDKRHGRFADDWNHDLMPSEDPG